MNYPLKLGNAALLFFAPCSSLISASSSSTLSAFPANMIPSRVDQMPPLTAETAVVTLSFKSSIIYGTSSVSMSMVCDALLNSVGLIEPKAESGP